MQMPQNHDPTMRILKKTAVLLLMIFSLGTLISIQMSHWMAAQPMQHGAHECCDFAPIQASKPTTIFGLLLPSLLAITIAFSTLKKSPQENHLNFSPLVVPVHHRRLLKGIVQRE